MSTLYTASNTSQQTIDTFDLPTIKSVTYTIHAKDDQDTSVTNLEVMHDGVDISEIQVSSSLSGIKPAEFTTDILERVGRVLVTPLTAPVDYFIEKTEIPCVQFGENTLSGRIIKTERGVGVYFSDTDTMTIRDADNNFYGDANAYLISNTFGPITTGPQLFDANTLASFNSAEATVRDSLIIVSSSNQSKNHMYALVPVEPGCTYRISANAYYEFESVRGNINTVDIGSRITVGSTINSTDLSNILITKTDSNYTYDFVPSTNTVFIGLGYGRLGATSFFNNLSIKQITPFPTYNTNEGTFYVHWNNTNPVPYTVLNMGDNSITVNADDNVLINDAIVGSVSEINKLAFTYNLDAINFSFNGSSPASLNTHFISNITTVTANTTLNEFAYMHSVVSNTTLSGLTNV